ncbi:hypothetical protein D3C80_1017350 [compost metagenome]
MAAHDWIRSTLNHGALQCRRCHCTDREAAFALGMECRSSSLAPSLRVIEGGRSDKEGGE